MKTQTGVIVIAGASKGLGRELALKAHENNFPIALLARNMKELQELREVLQEKNSDQQVSIHSVNIADLSKTYEVFNDIVTEHSKIRALVNCAATWTGGESGTKSCVSEPQRGKYLLRTLCISVGRAPGP